LKVNTNDSSKNIIEQRTVFEHVSAKLHAHASFALFEPILLENDDKENPMSICRLESHRINICLPMLSNGIANISTLTAFVKEYNHPLISQIDNHNFKRLGSLGKLQVILIVNYKDEILTTGLISMFRETASALPNVKSDKIVFGHIDGVMWRTFLKQYDFSTTPSLLVLNVALEQFLLYPIPLSNSSEFLTTTVNDIASTPAETLNLKQREAHGVVGKILKKLKDNYPWSLLCALPFVLLVLSIFVFYPDENKPKKD
jgi:hypothetical protein